MEEPGRLLSMGSHRVGHDWRDLVSAAAALCVCVCVCVGASSCLCAWSHNWHFSVQVSWNLFFLHSAKCLGRVFVGVCVSSSFILLALYHSIIWMFYSWFSCSLIPAFLGCFQIVTSRNRTSINNFVYDFVCSDASIFWKGNGAD